MKEKKEYIDKYITEMSIAVNKKDFVAMSEIYAEIERLYGKKQSKMNVFFSELEKDYSIKLPREFISSAGNSVTGAFVHEKNKCIDIHCETFELEKWQEDFIKKDFSAIYEEISISVSKIYINNKLQNILGWNFGDIVKIILSDGIMISKFNIEELCFENL